MTMSMRAAPDSKSTQRAPAKKGVTLKAAVLILLLLLLAGGIGTAGVIFATHHTVQYRYRTRVVIRRVPVPVIRYRTRTVTITGVPCWEHDGSVELSPPGTGPRARTICRETTLSPASSHLVEFTAPDGAAVTYTQNPPGS
jgi:hypothetical protein